MKCTKIFSYDDFLTNSVIAKATPVILNLLQNVIANKTTLFIGFGDHLLDSLDNGRLYYAIPKTHEITHWPKIRPFKTVVIDKGSLPFAPGTFDVVVISHYFEFFENNTDFLQEVFRILKRDGKLITSVLNNRSSICKKIQEKTRSTNAIISDIIASPFHISNFWVIKKNSRLLSYNFDSHLNNFNEMLLKFFCLLSDIVIIGADKSGFATESISVFEERYELS
jgi:SAM-dependent methyltransferase